MNSEQTFIQQSMPPANKSQIKHATGNSVKQQRQNNMLNFTNSNNNQVTNSGNNLVTNNITNNITITFTFTYLTWIDMVVSMPLLLLPYSLVASNGRLIVVNNNQSLSIARLLYIIRQ